MVGNVNPAASDEPGVASLWEKITDQTGGGGGFSFTQGNADPSGGSAGDWYLQHDGAGETEAIWFNIAGTWTEYEIPTAGTSTDDQNAGEVPTSTANFDGNLSASDNDVQAALDTIDDLSVGGGGTDDQTAAEVPVTTTNFDGNLSGTDDDVQAALETLDDLSVSGGTGDITAVGTAANSGLAGGADSGDVDLTVDLSNLASQNNVAGGDHVGFYDVSASVSKRITVQNYAAHLFPTSGGLAPTTSGQGHVRLHGLPGLTTFEGSDELGLTDDSTSDNVTKKATLVHVVEHVAGPDFDVSTEAVMSLADGVSERLCPDPSTGTSGQVCARNAAGAYVLVTPSGGGGGGTSVDAVDVQFITNTRSIRVDVQQADGNDFDDSALIPLATDTVPGFTEHATNAEATAGTATNRSLVPGNLASIFGSVISDTDINVASPSSESTAVGASRQAVAEAISDNGRRAHTTANPADIDGVADPGSGAAVNHPNHVHRLQTDETLEFSAGGNLGVSITDVVEHLQQRIQYYTNDNDHSTDGSAAGMVYRPSNYPKNIATIKAEVRPTTGSIYKAGIYTVTSGNQIISVLGQSADSDEVPANTNPYLDVFNAGQRRRCVGRSFGRWRAGSSPDPTRRRWQHRRHALPERKPCWQLSECFISRRRVRLR